MAIIQFEVQFAVDVQIGNSWYEKTEPTASLGHAIRQAKALIKDEGISIEDVRITKRSLRKEVLDIDLTT